MVPPRLQGATTAGATLSGEFYFHFSILILLIILFMNCWINKLLVLVLTQESAQERIEELEGQLLMVTSANERMRAEITNLVSYIFNFDELIS